LTEHRRGLAYGVAAYVLWGIVPAYWKLFADVSPVEILAHRAVWGLGAFLVLAAISGELGAVKAALRDRRVLGTMVITAALLSVNWGVFIAAISAGHLLDASLGYFINPLVSVALGMVFLGERLRRLQAAAIALAAIGVALITWSAGRPPWIALILAFSFGSYGLVRKLAKVPSLAGSTVETLVMAPIAVIYLAVLAARGDGGLGHGDLNHHLLLISTGVISAVPLLLFTSAARRLPLATIGFLQYLAPTGQFLLAVLAYDEPFETARLAAFAFIWAGLAIFTIDLLRRPPPARSTPAAPARPAPGP